MKAGKIHVSTSLQHPFFRVDAETLAQPYRPGELTMCIEFSTFLTIHITHELLAWHDKNIQEARMTGPDTVLK